MCAVDPMTFFLRLLAPALLLGSFLLLGERPSNPPDEAPALTSVSDAVAGAEAPCPGHVDGLPAASLAAIRLTPARAARLKAGAPPPEARSLSPPAAV